MKGDKGRFDPKAKDKYRENYDRIFNKKAKKIVNDILNEMFPEQKEAKKVYRFNKI